MHNAMRRHGLLVVRNSPMYMPVFLGPMFCCVYICFGVMHHGRLRASTALPSRRHDCLYSAPTVVAATKLEGEHGGEYEGG